MAWSTLWKTTSHLVGLVAGENKEALEKASQSGEDLVVFLQGASIGGIEHDIATLLRSGFSVEIVLINAEDPDILHKRIKHRANEPGAYGAKLMSKEDLEDFSRDCNVAFKRIVQSLHEVDSANVKVMSAFSPAPQEEEKKEDFYDVVRKYQNNISYSVHLTRKILADADISTYMGPKLEKHLMREVYSQHEIQVDGSGIVLGKSGAKAYVLNTA